jgi:queuine tRNA-ribosyltransferase
MNPFAYRVVASDPACSARAGELHTPHGVIPTPIFMPVGTKATVKGILPSTLHEIGAKIILANTYHLSQRPGEELIASMGGLHTFMNWDGPILTDSGGFQVFSHEDHVRLKDDGVGFRAVDYGGEHIFWTPEENMRIAEALGADIVMQLDVCSGWPVERKKLERAVKLSSDWAKRCWDAHTRQDQALFGIVQGGMDLELRKQSLDALLKIGEFPGFGIGGYSVGEPHETMFESLAPLCEHYMPTDRPRYLMGVGNPTTLVQAVGCGVDMFDCVLPTRTARMGTAFSSAGRMNLKQARYAQDPLPVDPYCTCPVCTQGYSRSYLRHLITQKEMLAGILLSIHNLYYLLDLMRQARAAILDGSYQHFMDAWFASPASRDY